MSMKIASVEAFENGQFAIVWMKELDHRDDNIKLYSRMYDNDGTPLTEETDISTYYNRYMYNYC